MSKSAPDSSFQVPTCQRRSKAWDLRLGQSLSPRSPLARKLRPSGVKATTEMHWYTSEASASGSDRGNSSRLLGSFRSHTQTPISSNGVGVASQRPSGEKARLGSE